MLWIAELTPGTEIFYAEKLRDLIKNLTIVSGGYREEKEKGIDTMTDIIVKYEAFVAMLGKVGEKTEVATEKQKTFGTVIVESVLPPARKLGKVVGKAIDEIETGITDVAKTWQEKFWGMFQDASQFMGALSGLFNQMSENENAVLERDYERRKSVIENSLMNEEEKAAAMESLDKEYERRSKEAARTQAKRTKAVGIMESIVATAAGVAKALPNIPLAIAVGIMGAIQTALIAAQPLPALAKGGAIGAAGIVGEEGPELFMPAVPGTIIPLRTEATATGGGITMTFLGPLISTTGVARADLERAGNTLWDIIEGQARRRGYSLNGA